MKTDNLLTVNPSLYQLEALDTPVPQRCDTPMAHETRIPSPSSLGNPKEKDQRGAGPLQVKLGTSQLHSNPKSSVQEDSKHNTVATEKGYRLLLPEP